MSETQEDDEVKVRYRSVGTLAPFMEDKDIDFLATVKSKLTQKDIAKLYVSNYASLDIKQRRKVFSMI